MHQIDEKTLELISNETKNFISNINIVTPSLYSDLFSKIALSYNVNISEENKITDQVLSKKISVFTDLQESTSKNAKILSENTDKAILAIKDKNQDILNEVLQETKNLHLEIERLKKSVYQDDLTNVYNRKWFSDYHLENESQRFKDSGTIAIIDLNYFKIINDTYGHIVGDKVLIFIAGQLKKASKSIVRYGGDEFIIIFPSSITKNDAINKLNGIREEILKKNLIIKDSSFKTSFSFGVCEYKKDDAFTDVIDKADNDMYQDKIEIKKRVTGI